ncbi:MAG: NAD(P)/FAD-dependent oxidoreductase [Roseiarcus sp.]|jgi:NADH dehydrogenase
MSPSPPEGVRLRIVIVGAGFGGLAAAKALAKAPVDVTVIDQHNYHLFQPLLYQVATAGLSPADIASPIRSVLARQRNTTVILAEVSGVDLERKQVVAEDRRVGYDFLVLATGARHAYFGHDDWARHAPGLKRIDDATYLRRRILLAFEKAESETDAQRRRSLLNFVVVGGGPTGVEMAGAIAELARKALKSDFRTIDPGSARIILVEAAPRLLTPFDPRLSEAARQSLERLGVEVRLGAAVTDCDADGIAIGAERIAAATIVWGAGVMASAAGLWLGAKTDRAGRVEVLPDLSLPGHPEVFVIGDTALAKSSDGKPLPGIAPVAKQQGAYVARLLIDRLRGRATPPFRYRDFGILATIGRKHAVVQMGPLRLSGSFAWLLWCFAHIYFLIGFRNRLAVVMNWVWNYLTFQRGTRLITGITGSRMTSMDEAMPPVGPPPAPIAQPSDAKRPVPAETGRPS